ncbi:NAD(P)/FAD-dependent oxidoreductase [Oceanicella actignis]|uniref:Flavoprotein, HI0933 family n=1 Tax=Oceanicella actignis TaxID=1189325 RepID=A0A1M7TP43_9RHOB|nr:NAD(P)/FAD-dependent oxidoreductase [Oceanicella actignis]SET73366.1 hypothetical protein SAMN04488119_10898 [Oceanicella actignis]SHN72507.1 hypothetical protein SAMN05216200_10899 [Oceanicella actignis]
MNRPTQSWDVVILGAGAAGMMCAIEAARRGRRTLALDHARAPGEKIRISGGGRCNFTNLNAAPHAYLSENPRFCVSALRRFTARDFVARVNRRGIPWHEKKLGQLFCDRSARDIVAMLTDDMREAGAELRLGAQVGDARAVEGGFVLQVDGQELRARRLVLACGGKSIPKMGATDFALRLARRFGLRVTPTRPGLVPLTFDAAALARTAPLSGVSVEAEAACGKTAFREALLFTHRGLSGPAILQISSYWREGDALRIDLAPGAELFDALRQARAQGGRRSAAAVLAEHMPRRLARFVAEGAGLAEAPLAALPDRSLRALAEAVHAWRVKPVGSEGWRTAEVMLGGVDTRDLDSRTMEARAVPGLHVIGEAADVTGWLGGYNFQWAWSSGWAAGQAV